MTSQVATAPSTRFHPPLVEHMQSAPRIPSTVVGVMSERSFVFPQIGSSLACIRSPLFLPIYISSSAYNHHIRNSHVSQVHVAEKSTKDTSSRKSSPANGQGHPQIPKGSPTRSVSLPLRMARKRRLAPNL